MRRGYGSESGLHHQRRGSSYGSSRRSSKGTRDHVVYPPLPNLPKKSKGRGKKMNYPAYKSTSSIKKHSIRLEMKDMMPLMMMNLMTKNRPKRQQQDSPSDRVSLEIKSRIQELASKQDQLLHQLKNEGYGERGDYGTERLLRRLGDMERRIERARKNKLRKKEKGGMPKFLMFMQQNMMNQMMLASQMHDLPEQMDTFPRIIPVPIDPKKRILPLSSNPFTNFERNQPKGPTKDLDLDYDGIKNLLAVQDDIMVGKEKSPEPSVESSSTGYGSGSGSRSGSFDSSYDVPTMNSKEADLLYENRKANGAAGNTKKS